MAVTLANGSRLAPRVQALIADAAKAAGITTDVVVTQGSWSAGSLSGDTHTGDGAADIRVWNLPRVMLAPLVLELRKRNCCAWLRDTAHGWTGGDHIHVIVRDQPGLSVQAAWQVKEYDLVHDGLARRGPDYHPRPVQRPWPFALVAPQPPAPYAGPYRLGTVARGVSSMRWAFGLPNPGHTEFKADLDARVRSWQKSHPWLFLRGERLGVVGRYTYASIMTRYPKG